MFSVLDYIHDEKAVSFVDLVVDDSSDVWD
jgi:hypothetical protein